MTSDRLRRDPGHLPPGLPAPGRPWGWGKVQGMWKGLARDTHLCLLPASCVAPGMKSQHHKLLACLSEGGDFQE